MTSDWLHEVGDGVRHRRGDVPWKCVVVDAGAPATDLELQDADRVADWRWRTASDARCQHGLRRVHPVERAAREPLLRQRGFLVPLPILREARVSVHRRVRLLGRRCRCAAGAQYVGALESHELIEAATDPNVLEPAGLPVRSTTAAGTWWEGRWPTCAPLTGSSTPTLGSWSSASGPISPPPTAASPLAFRGSDFDVATADAGCRPVHSVSNT